MVELARSVRSGVVETRHYGNVAAVSADGKLIAGWGDVDERSFYRSAIKPFQATMAQELGAALSAAQMALACASHTAQPIHVAIVRQMLIEAGLSEADLGTPPATPTVEGGLRPIARYGTYEPRRIFYNCSGKHAAFLRACRAQDWPSATYLDPEHPLQVRTVGLVAEMADSGPTSTGTDGCGAPAPSGSVRELATAFARLSVEDRFAEARTAMSRYPALVGSNHKEDGRIASWWGGVVKRGAQGTIAACRNGIGIAVKASDGSPAVAATGLLSAMDALGLLTNGQREHLAATASPVVFGGGRPAGRLEPVSLAASS